jgi:adenosylcobinamide kinase / adenosylcobinamide-phosphate guanylyltransferase
MHELILGGARSGKSRAAELRAAAWLRAPLHEAALVATAQAGDADMHARIARHQADRAQSVPQLSLHEEPRELAAAIASLSSPRRMVVVDCLTLWCTNLRMPLTGAPLDEPAWSAHEAALIECLQSAPGPVVLVSNEIGLGVMPMGAPTRHFVDALGRLHQRVAGVCSRVTLLVAGLELAVKPGPAGG